MSLWEEVKSLKEEFLFEMTNVRGEEIKVADVNFSFYFSSKEDVNHGMRIKVKWSPSKINKELDGYFEMHGDYKYHQSLDSKNKPSGRDLKKARAFLKDYKVLFSAVWENILAPYYLEAFLRGDKHLEDLIQNFKGISLKDKECLLRVVRYDYEVDKLEDEVRKLNLFNLND